MHIFSPQNEGQAELHPPIFTGADATTVHGDLSAGLGGSSFALVIALKWGEISPLVGSTLQNG